MLGTSGDNEDANEGPGVVGLLSGGNVGLCGESEEGTTGVSFVWEAGEGVRGLIEVRRNPDGTVDEIVATECTVHLEQMDTGSWWMGISIGDETMHVHFNARGKIGVSVEDEPEKKELA